MNVLLLGAGKPKFELEEGGYPSVLTEINEKSLLQIFIEKCKEIDNINLTCSLRESEIKKFHLDKITKIINPSTRIVSISDSCRGAACTALLSLCSVNNDDELLIMATNEIIDLPLPNLLLEFRAMNCDAVAVCFKSLHPRYSYVLVDHDMLVTEASSMNPISNIATTSMFWFRKTSEFLVSVKHMIQKECSHDDQFYIAPALNEMILNSKIVKSFIIDNNKYLPLKSSSQIRNLELGDYNGNT